MGPAHLGLLAFFAGSMQAAANGLRIAMYSGEGAILSGDADFPYEAVLSEAALGLTQEAHLEVLNGKADVMAKLSNANFDLVFFPGGSGTGQALGLGADGREAVKSFVRNGGGFVATCGGAFLALQHLKLYGEGPAGHGIPADSLGEGDTHVAFSAAALRDVFTELDLSSFTNESALTIYYMGGPTVVDYETVLPESVGVLASYTDDVPSDGSSGAGEGAGTPAITYAVYGNGRVVLNAPHPEHVKSETGVGVPVYRGELAWAARWGEASAQKSEDLGEGPAHAQTVLHM